jgi:hypothetical protein
MLCTALISMAAGCTYNRYYIVYVHASEDSAVEMPISVSADVPKTIDANPEFSVPLLPY